MFNNSFCKTLRNSFKVVLISCMFISLLAFGFINSAYAEETFEARLSYHWTPNHNSAKYASKFAEEVEKATNGRVKIEQFHSGQLYGNKEALSAVSGGAVDMAGVLDLSLARVEKNFHLSYLGFFWPGYEEMHEFYNNNPKGREMIKNTEEKLGIKLLCFNPCGPNAIMSTEKLTGDIEDLKGLKSRYITSAEIPALKAFEMKSLEVTTGEVYEALERGRINTIMTNPPALKAYSWTDYIDYVIKPYVNYVDSWVVINADWWDSLPADIQETMEEVADRIGEEAANNIISVSDEILKEFDEEMGGEVVTLSDSQLEAFRELYAKEVWPELGKEMDEKYYKAAKKFMGYE